MEFSDLIKSRYSVRKFKKTKVEREKLNKILEAGKLSPTAVNYQPQRILVLNDEKSLNKIKECTPYHFNAPLILIICYDKTVSWKRSLDNKEMGDIDASIVATSIMYEVTNLGLGSTCVGHFDPEKIKTAFYFPENIIPVIMLPIGYPSDESKPHPFHSIRYDIDKTTYYNSFNK